MSEPTIVEKPFAAWSPRQVVPATVVVLLVMGGCWLIFTLYRVLFLAFVAIVLATAFEPLVVRAQRWLGSRAIGTLIVYVTLFALLLGGLLTLAPVLAEQVIVVSESVPKQYDDLREQMFDSPSRFIRGLAHTLPRNLRQPKPAVNEGPVDRLVETFGYLGSIAGWVTVAVLTLLLAFYWSLFGERTIRASLLWLRPERREAGRELVVILQEKLGAYLRGQALLCLIVGSLSLVCYLIIGLPQPLAFACLVGVLEAMPVFGPVLGALPPLLTAMAEDPALAWWVLAANIGIQQVENYLLVPRIMDRSVGINPIVTLLAIVAFGALIGPLGAVMAIPLAAIVQTLLHRFVLERNISDPPLPEGRSHVSRLRYETQELMRDVRKQGRLGALADGEPLGTFEDRIEELALALDHALAKADAPAAEGAA